MPTAPEFTVSPMHVQTLSFGTCQFSFQNLSPSEVMGYCWRSLVSVQLSSIHRCGSTALDWR